MNALTLTARITVRHELGGAAPSRETWASERGKHGNLRLVAISIFPFSPSSMARMRRTGRGFPTTCPKSGTCLDE